MVRVVGRGSRRTRDDGVSENESGERGDRADRGDRPREEGSFARTLRELGPVAGGLILDLADLASFGPVGVIPGLAIGGGLGWYLSGVYGYRSRWRPWVALAAAVYCGFPLTEPLPLATILTVISRLAPRSGAAGPGDDGPDARDA